jgi:hypothetical protein
MNALEAVVIGLHDSLAAAAGVEITYSRGEASVELVAVRGRIDHEEIDIDRGSVSSREAAFIVKTDELRLSAGAILPQVGDTIEITGGASYRVQQITGDRCYRFTDQTQKLLRIYTVET